MKEGRWFGWLLGAGTIAGLVFWWTRKAMPQLIQQPLQLPKIPNVPKTQPKVTSTPAFPYTTEFWRPVLIPLCIQAQIPLEFAMKWIDVESGGNPCAVGNPFASFDGGAHPREAGIIQLFGPDDYTTTKTDPNALRAYCSPSFMGQYKDSSGNVHQAMEFSQVCTRPLTSDEILEQARSAIALIQAERRRADHLLMSVGAAWPANTASYWAFVKLQHALPGLANAIAFVKAALGHAPVAWSEYASTVMSSPVQALIKVKDPGTWKYASDFPKELANAAKTGAVVRPVQVAV